MNLFIIYLYLIKELITVKKEMQILKYDNTSNLPFSFHASYTVKYVYIII